MIGFRATSGSHSKSFRVACRAALLALGVAAAMLDRTPAHAQTTTAPTAEAAIDLVPSHPAGFAPVSGKSAASAPDTDSWAGIWRSGEIGLQLVREGESYSGSLVIVGQEYPLKAKPDAGAPAKKLAGTFTNEGEQFAFTATIDDEGNLTLKSDDTEFILKRDEPPKPPRPANPLAKAAQKGATPGTGGTAATPAPAGPAASAATPTSPATPAAAAAAIPADATAFKAASGLRFHLPKGWKAQENPQGIVLTPGDTANTATELNEIYVAAQFPAAKQSRPDDPEFIAGAEEYLSQQFDRVLTRSGAPTKVEGAKGPAAILTWESELPGGETAQFRSYVVFLKQNIVAFVAISTPQRLRSRDADLRTLLVSADLEAGARDTRIVGQWMFYSYKSSADGSFGTETKRYATVLADGTLTVSTQSESSGSFKGTDSSGNTTWQGGVASQGGNSESGTWTASGGNLRITMSDGTVVSARYSFKGDQGQFLVIDSGDGKPQEWSRLK